MDNWLAISFYTPKYREIVEELKSSLDKFSIPYDIEERESLGNWLLNCNHKPIFIKDKFLKHKKNIVWIDADAVVYKYPKYFDVIEEEVGVYADRNWDFKSGTVFFSYNEKTLGFIDTWNYFCKENSKDFDQLNLKRAISECYYQKHNISVFFLPHTYCQIFDLMNWGEPVIEQHQASRKFR